MEAKTLSASLENYLEAIYQISQEKQFAQANMIAETLAVGKSSVSWALNQLAGKRLINYAPYEAITLTEKGRIVAERIVRRHAGIKSFLTDVLTINEQVAEENACRMEHVVDREILLAMQKFMDFLQKCPRVGQEWMQGFGFFCEQGKHRDNCRACLSECFDRLVPASGAAQGGLAVREVPKVSKDRDQITLERLKEVLHESGRSFSYQQTLVAEVFMHNEAHQTLERIHEMACRKAPGISMECVKSTMAALCEHKIARALRFEDQVAYEHHHPESHHDHLFCVKCGAVVEFFDPRIEALQNENARRADFRLLMHTLNIYGVCHECIRKESRVHGLSECLSGETVKVVRIEADNQTQARVADMGLPVGTAAQLLSEDCGGGSVIVLAGGTRLMLDAETADKIKVVLSREDGAVGGEEFRRGRHHHVADRVNSFALGRRHRGGRDTEERKA